MRFPWRIMAVTALTLLAGLTWQAAGGRNGEPEPEPEPRREELAGLLYTLNAAAATTRVGEDLELKLTIFNHDPAPIAFEFPGGQECDFIAARDGTVVWQWSRWRPPPDPAPRRVLAPGDALVYAATWDGRDDRGKPLEPGLYEVRAVFLGEAAEVRFVGPLMVELR